MMRARALACLVLLLAGPALPARGADEEVVVGILEDLAPRQREALARAYGTPATAVIRVAFAKRAGEWQAFKSDPGDPASLETAAQAFPKALSWTVGFDGKALGRLTSVTPAAWQRYADLGLQLLAPGQAVPRVGTPGGAFEPWDGDAPVHRPLVVVSRPQVADPDGWKPGMLPPGLLKDGIAAFQARLATEEDGLRVEAGDVRLVKAYRSAAGELVYALLRRQKPPEDEVPGTEWDTHWFVASAAGATRFIGSGMTLIDAGDYDADGRSEVVFATSAYDRAGYALFFDDFRRSVTFSWGYH